MNLSIVVTAGALLKNLASEENFNVWIQSG